MAILELKNVAKKFTSASWGVKDINITVADKEFVVLLGPSGCGKTTTIRLIAGLEQVTAGSILVDNQDVTCLPPRKRNISMVFQNYAVWPHMTVFENIAFALRLRKLPETDITTAVNDAAQLTQIQDYLDRRPTQLSGGQQQRVALARALAVKPSLFLMDEPFSNLDATLRVAMRTELKTIHQQAQATTIFVTHDQAEAMSMADRIVIIKDGRVIQTGTPDDVYFRSADLFVAGFIGTPPMNFFDVHVTCPANTGPVLSNDFFSMQITTRQCPDLDSQRGQRIVLGIRPEDITLVEPGTGLFSLPVLVSEPQGSHQVVSIKLSRQIVKIITPPIPKFTPGTNVGVQLNPDKLHFFTHDTGTRI